MTLTIREGSFVGSGRIKKEIKRNNGGGQNRTKQNRMEPNEVERNGTEWNGTDRIGAGVERNTVWRTLREKQKRERRVRTLYTRGGALKSSERDNSIRALRQAALRLVMPTC